MAGRITFPPSVKKSEELQLIIDVLWPVKALTLLLHFSLTSLTDYFFLL